MKKHLLHFFIILCVALGAVSPLQAQTAGGGGQPALDSLSSLPESEIIIHINISRIINDAMPRLVPEKELKNIQAAMEQMKAFSIDLKTLEFIALTMRFNKPTGGSMFPIPEAMITVRGDFDAKALLGMAMMMASGKMREEQYGAHRINLLKLSDVSKEAASSPFGAAFSEIAMTALDPSTIAVGNTSYIKAALDAADGRGRINPRTIDSLMRSPDALISSAGSPLMAFASSFALRIAKERGSTAPEPHFGDYYLSFNMDTANFKITGALFADNPETAGIIKNMLSGALDQAKNFGAGKEAQEMIKQVSLVAEGSEVMVQATIPQETAVKFFRDMFAPKPPPKPPVVEATSATSATAGATTKPPANVKKKTTRSRRKN